MNGEGPGVFDLTWPEGHVVGPTFMQRFPGLTPLSLNLYGR